MMSATEKFISSFHSISGTTIGERRKNLFLLLNQTQKSLQEGSEINFSSLRPETPLEEAFKVEALLYFQRTPDLVEVLKSENPAVIKKALKGHPKFLEQAFLSLNGEQLVTSIFPYVSFNVKVKIVNKLSVCLSNPQQSDSFFEAIRQKYGLYLALKLLPSCSENFILEFAERCGKKISPRQLLLIIKKNPNLIESIFKALHVNMSKLSVGRTYRTVFLYLARSNNGSFLSLYEKYDPELQLRLGWRATNKFIHANKQTIIKNAKDFHKLLHKKQSYKSLGPSFSEFYLNLFPTSIEAIPISYHFLFSFIEKLPSDAQKVSVFEQTFRKMYGTEVWNHPNCLTVSLLDLTPLEKRQGIKVEPRFMSEVLWSCYLNTDQSLPLLKKRISLASHINTRVDLLTLLVETCRINNDTLALKSVCKYVVAQHRNDHVSARHRFLAALQKSFKLETLEEEHWLYINELIQIFEVNAESFSLATDFLLAYIHHRLLRALDVEQLLAEYLKMKCGKLNLFTHNAVFEKLCLVLIGELIPQVFSEDVLKDRNVEFLEALIDWNSRHPEDQFSIFRFPAALDSFKHILKKCNYGSQRLIIHCLKSGESEDSLLRLCLSKLTGPNRTTLNWLLQHRTLLVAHNIETVTELLLKNSNHFFWRHCKNYTHLELPQKISAICVNVLDAQGRDIERRNAVIGLSYLMNAGKFLELSANFYPTELKMDTQNEEARKKYRYQTAVASCLRNVTPTSLALESVLKFCKGDYLKLILGSLYSVSGNVNEDKLPEFFGELAGQAVSIRKHAFHLTLRVLDRSLIFATFNKFMETEQNASIRKFLLDGSMRLFVQDPDDCLWQLVQQNAKAIDKDDTEVIEILMEIHLIPVQYLVEYILFVWDFLERSPSGEEHKFKLLRSLSPSVIQKLPTEFCYGVVNKYLSAFDGTGHSRQFRLHSFTCKFIIYCDAQVEQKGRMSVVFPVLVDYIQKGKPRGVVHDFVKMFCSEFLQKKCLSKTTLSAFTTLWNSHVKPHEAFDEYLYLQLCLIYVDAINEDLSTYQIGEKLAKLSNLLSPKYGTTVIQVFCDMLGSFVKYFVVGAGEVYDKNLYTLIEAILNSSLSHACVITAIPLLKRHVRDKDPIFSRHVKIVKMLKSLSDPLIPIYLNHHLHRMNI